MKYTHIRVTRKQLEAFLPDPEAIRQFEQLIAMFNSIVPPTDTEVALSAAIAETRATEAIDLINKLTKVVEELSLQPKVEYTDFMPLIEALQSLPPEQPALDLMRLIEEINSRPVRECVDCKKLIEELAARPVCECQHTQKQDEIDIDHTPDVSYLMARIEDLERTVKDDIAMLKTLADVAISTPRDLDLLQFNGTLKRWESGALPWVDVDFPIIIRTTGSGQPTLAVVNGNITMPQWQVNDYNMCECQEFIHGWKEGTEVFWHLHLTTNDTDATDRYVRFTLEYGYVDVDGQWVFPATLNSGDLLIPAATPDKTMIIMTLGSFTPAIHIGGHSVAYLKRVAAVGAAPTKDPWIPMLQQHLQMDTIGSRLIGTK
jgi:hypothetical protein